MKWFGTILIVALLAVAPGPAGAEPPGGGGTAPATPPQGAGVKGEPAGAVQIYTPEEKKEYQTKTAAELAAVQDKIYNIKMNAGAGPRKSRRLIPKMANHLQALVLAAKNQLASLEQTPNQTWGERKAEMDKTMDELAKAVQEVEAHLK
jgi:hypothetical protein